MLCRGRRTQRDGAACPDRGSDAGGCVQHFIITSTWLAWFLASLAVLSLNGCSPDPAPKESGKSELSAADGHEAEILHRLHTVTWNVDSHFYDLLAFCQAQVDTAADQSTCAIDPGSAAEAVQFADALWLIWTGRTHSARQILQRLLAQGSWCGWGQAGLLQLALHTEDHKQLASLLAEFASPQSTCGWGSASLFQHYSILLALESADWKALDRLLKELPQQAVLDSPSLFLAQAKYYYAVGRAADLATLLAAATPEVQESTEYLTQQAKFTALNEGVGSWSRAFHAQSKRHLTDRSLAIDAALSDLLDDSPEVVSAAAEKLEDIAVRSSKDVRLQMHLAIMLALHRQPEASERVYRRIETIDTSLQDFTAFHTLVAWNAIYRDDLEQAKKSIVSALSMAPRHYGANYLKALIAKKEGDSASGLEALHILQGADPYNENVRSMIKGFYENFPSEDWKALYSSSQRKWSVVQHERAR